LPDAPLRNATVRSGLRHAQDRLELAETFAYSAIAQVFTTSVPVHRSRRRPAKAQ
jgi:hypothetical protein